MFEDKEIEEIVDKILKDLYYEHTDEEWAYFKKRPYERNLAINYNELRTVVRLAYVIGRNDEIESRNI